ncbi:MAG: leucine-rich repeat domain-containing protein [Ruminococcus sp.]
MRQFLKKTLWAALLTAAFALTATGCGEQDGNNTGASPSSATQAQEESSSIATEAENAAQTSVFSYQMNEDGTISITGYSGSDTALNVPATIDGYVVSAIDNHAFEANWDITSVTLPNGLTAIGEGAFMDCGSLTTVTIPETVSRIDRAAFAGCSMLTAISLPETVSVVMEEAFTGCGSLTDLTVANSALEYDSWGIIEGAEPLNVTITCPSGSAIESWAAANGIATQALS